MAWGGGVDEHICAVFCNLVGVQLVYVSCLACGLSLLRTCWATHGLGKTVLLHMSWAERA